MVKKSVNSSAPVTRAEFESLCVDVRHAIKQYQSINKRLSKLSRATNEAQVKSNHEVRMLYKAVHHATNALTNMRTYLSKNYELLREEQDR
jgi:2-keto-3-deoxy-L-rhamnonate aldolase RhmA